LLVYLIGDSGGPIHQWVGNHWIQVGIVSFGTKCAEADYPGIYTRLSSYYDWLDSNRIEIGPLTYGLITATVTSGAISTIDGCRATNIIGINFFFVLIPLIYHFCLFL